MKSEPMSSLNVIAPGILSLLTDAGRLGQQQIGLTNGGPLDPFAFEWANRLCHNPSNTTAIEVTIGGLVLSAAADTQIALTGAELPLSVNGQAQPMWQTINIAAGDKIQLGYAGENGSRAYLAIAGGFAIAPQFGSTATVVREGIGGLDGRALQKGDKLPIGTQTPGKLLRLPPQARPHYAKAVNLRVVVGYQQQYFSAAAKARFFHSEYQVSERCDRMGYRLEGPSVSATIDGILSEGICLGAIQVPADGQPIVLLNDRQTIGGYPKLGSVLSLDIPALAQLGPGGKVRFSEIDIDSAHHLLLLEQRRQDQLRAEEV
ncbi:MAG: biotin-dependent carboxyltransferase family protein [Cellvibrionaceae bacterium]|nr:biotin-dependent carboxyltransferase family protein [Cellvibrionaceae bacterium]